MQIKNERPYQIIGSLVFYLFSVMLSLSFSLHPLQNYSSIGSSRLAKEDNASSPSPFDVYHTSSITVYEPKWVTLIVVPSFFVMSQFIPRPCKQYDTKHQHNYKSFLHYNNSLPFSIIPALPQVPVLCTQSQQKLNLKSH